MRFIVDTNAGKLAKWLRMLGYDAAFFNGKNDSEIIARALKEGRILLTRDTHLIEWGIVRNGQVQTLLVRSDIPDLQITQVIRELGIKEFPGLFSICLECNSRIINIEKTTVADIIPPYVLQTQEEFKLCPQCHRIYWRGTHWDIMQKRIEALLRDAGDNQS